MELKGKKEKRVEKNRAAFERLVQGNPRSPTPLPSPNPSWSISLTLVMVVVFKLKRSAQDKSFNLMRLCNQGTYRYWSAMVPGPVNEPMNVILVWMETMLVYDVFFTTVWLQMFKWMLMSLLAWLNSK
jgi:hypothetical protein